MQLPATDELVLVSGLAPIRAQKLRYFEDRRFAGRVLPPPALAKGGYVDRPAQRSDDWGKSVRGVDARLGAADRHDVDEGVAGGLEQARHPGHEIDKPAGPEPVIADPPGLDDGDPDLAADKRAMDQARALGTARTMYAIDAGGGRPGDLQLDL